MVSNNLPGEENKARNTLCQWRYLPVNRVRCSLLQRINHRAIVQGLFQPEKKIMIIIMDTSKKPEANKIRRKGGGEESMLHLISCVARPRLSSSPS